MTISHIPTSEPHCHYANIRRLVSPCFPAIGLARLMGSDFIPISRDDFTYAGPLQKLARYVAMFA